jgi:flagellin-specific chaperone FliS
MAESRDNPSGNSVGPRTGSDLYNTPQEIAVLRAEVRALEAVVEQKVAEYERLITDRWANHAREHAMIQEAVSKAETSVDKRLEAMNELRVQINAERSSYLPRAVYETNHEELRQRVLTNNESIIKMAAETSGLREDLAALKAGQEWLLRVVVGAVVTGIVGVLFTLLRLNG